MKLTKERLLAFCLGFIYLWFGVLKFFPGVSPAEELATETIKLLTFDLIPSTISIDLLAIWETFLGIFFLLNLTKKPIIFLALTHITLTFTPLLFFPEVVFNEPPLQLSMIGQYIMKNVLIIGVLLMLLDKNNSSNLINFKKQ